EIMVVITIMTMIMGAVGVGVMSYLDKSKIKQARIDIATISNALDLYKTEFGKYPDSEDGLSRLVEEKILKEKKAPRDPWGNDFIYIYPGSNNEDGFDLYSFGPDGKEGGNDDIVNWDTE
ncbi:MAG TPA: type II secretion system major pseudopilin GspG, partial [bacterium]|nr:type II secretion system major pseudopilin GspG [bacterium]